MVTEDAFQAMLDEDPTNCGTRLVFADWLEEQGDPRAAGYRWMGDHAKWPYDWLKLQVTVRHKTHDWYRTGGGAVWEVPSYCQLPEWLWKRLQSASDWAGYASRRAAEEALCAALNQGGTPPAPKPPAKSKRKRGRK